MYSFSSTRPHLCTALFFCWNRLLEHRGPRAVRDADALIDAVEAMIVRRSAGATNKNAHSSRSHAIFTIGMV
jgi:hypothetical protein